MWRPIATPRHLSRWRGEYSNDRANGRESPRSRSPPADTGSHTITYVFNTEDFLRFAEAEGGFERPVRDAATVQLAEQSLVT